MIRTDVSWPSWSLREVRDWLGERNESLHAVGDAHEESDRRDLRDTSGDNLTDTLHEPREQILVLSPLAEHDAHLVIVLGVPDHRADDELSHGRQFPTPGHPVDSGQANGFRAAVNGEEDAEGLSTDDLTGDRDAARQRANCLSPGLGNADCLTPAVLGGPRVLAHALIMARDSCSWTRPKALATDRPDSSLRR